MDTLLSFITNLGVWILALMGVGMSFNPPSKEDRRTQWIWFGAFAVVSLVAGGSGFWNGVRNQAAQEELEAKLTGANNYCYFQADLNRPQPKGGYEWQLINKKQRPIPNSQICLYLNGKFSRCWKHGMCIPHAVDQAKDEGPLPIGKHHFEFFAANSWSQTLEIYMDGKTAKQRGEIIRDGKVIGGIPAEPR